MKINIKGTKIVLIQSLTILRTELCCDYIIIGRHLVSIINYISLYIA